MGVILIDDRAGSKDLIHHPPLNTLGTLTRLPWGDVCFPGNGPEGPVLIGIELKSITDLLSSIHTKRLQASQLLGMSQEYDVSYILYYGFRRSNPKTGNLDILKVRKRIKAKGGRKSKFRWKLAETEDLTGRDPLTWVPTDFGSSKRPVPFGYHQKFLFSADQAHYHYDWVCDVREAAHWIGALYRWWKEKWKDHSSFRVLDETGKISKHTPSIDGNPFSPSLSDDERDAAQVAKVVNGIGDKTAIAIGKHFGHPSRVVHATVEEWKEIPGVGKTLAGSAYRTFNGGVRETGVVGSVHRKLARGT